MRHLFPLAPKRPMSTNSITPGPRVHEAHARPGLITPSTMPQGSRQASTEVWRTMSDSNRRLPAGQAGTLAAELMVLKKNGLGGEARTPDPLLPKQMRYQAALHREG